MTGTIEDGFHLRSADPWRSNPLRAGALPTDDDLSAITEAAALLEQAKGVLIFRYSIGACAAFSLIEQWAEQAGVTINRVAHALVYDICQGARAEPSDPRFVRWLEDQLRCQFPGEPYAVPRELPPVPPPVTVAVDQTDSSLDGVVEAAREASRRCVPLEITADPQSLRGILRPQIVQRMNLAVELARAVAPSVEVRLPEDDR